MTPSQKLIFRTKEIERTGASYDDAFQQAQAELRGVVDTIMNGKKTPVEIANERATQSRRAAAERKIAARAEFNEKVKAVMGRGHDYDRAYRICLRDFPQFANEMDAPLFTPQQCNLLGLSGNATQEEAAAAYKANGNTFSPVDFKKVHVGVMEHYQKTDGSNQAEAIKKIRENHPRLSDAMQALCA